MQASLREVLEGSCGPRATAAQVSNGPLAGQEPTGGYRPDSSAPIMCDPMSVVPTAWPPGAAMSRVR